ncbi:hypothetical protein [Vibrio variabilis]|uniref:hypothetical protein n=1 Tax=Vibrio variabilis TaxID=990271 RepID=UPI001EFA1DD5|nr:hypothetical protein [Vibrio variabilis]
MRLKLIFALLASSSIVCAEDKLQDMSNPIAIYTQAGVGLSNKGINLKFGNTYDTGNDTSAGMNIIELKGIMGDTFGWADESVSSNSIDSFRIRNFYGSTETWSGRQLDLDWRFHTRPPLNDLGINSYGTASYALAQALPPLGPFQLFPIIGVGAIITDTDDGFKLPGVFAVAGFYGKVTLSDKIWLNYNPMYMRGISGVKTPFGDMNEQSLLAHEIAASYQLNPRQNIRLFVNFTNRDDDSSWSYLNDKGDIRFEFNHQF